MTRACLGKSSCFRTEIDRRISEKNTKLGARVFLLLTHLGLLAMVWTVLLSRNALLGKGQLDVLQILVLVESDLDAARAFADTAEVVLVQVYVDYLLGS